MVRLVEPCLLGGFPGLSTSDFLFSDIFMWLFWVQCWHSENILMPASLLLFGTLSPPKWLFWQYGRGPSCSLLNKARHSGERPTFALQHGLCLSVLYTGRFFTVPNRKTSVTEVPTYLSPKELDCPQCLKVLHKTLNEFYTWQILMLEDV